jgi:hypothetical protein
MATLKINLTAIGDASLPETTPAGFYPKPGWYVNLLKPDGTVFTRANKPAGFYYCVQLNHGYCEINDVPPGRYLVHAMQNPFPVGPIVIQSNYLSHYAVVDVCCGCSDVCVTLYNPGVHYCVRILIPYFQLLSTKGLMDPKIAQNAMDALMAVDKSAGKTSPSDAAMIKLIEQQTKDFVQSFKEEKKIDK